MAAELKVLNSTLWGEQHLVFTGTTVIVGSIVGIYFPSCWILFHFQQDCIEHCIKRFSSFFNLRRIEGAWTTHDLESTPISAKTLASPYQQLIPLLPLSWEERNPLKWMCSHCSESLDGFWEHIPRLLLDVTEAGLNSSIFILLLAWLKGEAAPCPSSLPTPAPLEMIPKESEWNDAAKK